jgi:hypothetical protein
MHGWHWLLTILAGLIDQKVADDDSGRRPSRYFCRRLPLDGSRSLTRCAVADNL